MAARKWTSEQSERQVALIRTWKPWTVSTGPRTPEGKAVASRNAVNYSCRELLREMAHQNRVLIEFINGMTPAPSWSRTKIDSLLNDLENALHAAAEACPTSRATLGEKVACASEEEAQSNAALY